MLSPIRSEIDALIHDIKSNEQNTISAIFAFPDNFTGFSGHFPENPILPGVCQIQCVLVLLSRIFKKETNLHAIKKVKFLNTVVPDEIIYLKGSAEEKNGNIQAVFKITKMLENKELNVSRLHLECRIDRRNDVI